MYPKAHLEMQDTGNSQDNIQQKEQCWKYQNTRLQTIIKAIAIKTVWYWHKNRYEDQQKRIENLDVIPHSYAHLIFNTCSFILLLTLSSIKLEIRAK
jgi:hypothetical protein